MSTIRELHWPSMPLTGMQLIEASAGSGKTYTLILLVLRQLLERSVSIREILLCTFTKAAARELRERIEQRLLQVQSAASAGGQWMALIAPSDALFDYLQHRWQNAGQQVLDFAIIERAMAQLPQAKIGTIHSFCAQILSEFSDATDVLGGALIDERNIIEQNIDSVMRMGVLRDDAQSAAMRSLPIASQQVAAFRQAVHVAYRYPSLQFAPVDHHAIVNYQARFAELNDAALQEEIRTVAKQSLACKLYKPKENFVLSVLRALEGRGQLDLSKVDEIIDRAELQKAGSKIKLPKLGAWLNSFAAAARLALRARHYQQMLQVITLTQQALQRHCQYVGARTQTALIGDLAAALDPPAGAARTVLQRAKRLAGTLRARFPVAFVDEFQDTDPAQLRILRRIYDDGGCLVAVGDPKQSIYRFRGADLHSYLQFADALPMRFSLDFNYRSTPALIAACNATMVPVADAYFATPGMTMRAMKVPARMFDDAQQSKVEAMTDALTSPLQWVAVDCQETNKASIAEAILQAMALRIQRRVQALAMAPRQDRTYQIAVLLPRRADIAVAQKALAMLGVEAITRGNVSVFGQASAALLYTVLSACAARHDQAAARAALLELLVLQQPPVIALAMLDRLDASVFIAHSRIALESAGPQALVRVILQQLVDADVCAQQVATADRTYVATVSDLLWSRTQTDLQHLAELLSNAIARHDLGAIARQQLAEQLAEWLLQRLPASGAAKYGSNDTQYESLDVQELDQIADGADQLRAIDGTSTKQPSCNVVLMTLHSAKGLEFNEVHLPLLWEAAPKPSGAVVLSPQVARSAVGQNLTPQAARSAIGQDLSPQAAQSAVGQDLSPQAAPSALVFDGGSADYDAALAQDTLEQELEKRRLLYVALTRAINAVQIYFTESAMQANANSALSTWRQLLQQSQIAPAVIRDVAPMIEATNTSLATPAVVRQLAAIDLDRTTIAKRAVQTVHSFSSLSANAVPAALEARDPDAEVNSDAKNAPDPFHAQALLHALRGAEFGTLIHAMLELDRDALNTEQLRLLSERIQDRRQRSLIIEQAPNLLAMIRRVRTTPLLGAIALDDIPADQRIAEFAFQMPAAAVDWSAFSALGPAHGLPALLPAVLHADAEQSRRHVNDLLIGFVDAVVMIDQRYHIIDFKTNWLGASLDDYRPDQLAKVITEQHYHLQYLLYVLALHRYLRAVQPGYCFADHMGDAHYLFVRAFGLDARAEHPDARLGHYRTRVPEALISAMDRLLRTANERRQ